ncbi:MAG: magnesium/cobalt transporter CorA [Candidatus Glassbacteria bacterium]|nr:magnesium/cobalt transporter CorA [Candidatus Glassbacteria bacterium]
MVSKFFKKVSKKRGLSPGSLVLVGEKKKYEVEITLFDYDEGRLEEKELEEVEESFFCKDRDTTSWISLNGVHDLEIIEKLGGHFGFNPLVMEDIVNTDQRPKLEDYEGYLFIVLKALHYDRESDEVKAGQVSLVLGKNIVISFQENKTDLFDPVIERIRKGKGRLRRMGSDYLAYALIDAVVDNYFVVLEKLGDRLEDLETELINDPAEQTLQQIYRMKKEMLFMRKSIWPLREVVGGLQREEYELVDEKTIPFLRDAYDHTIQVIDTIETFRDILSGMLDMYLSSISNRMNSVMKVLTIIATIFIPLTFIAGIYGMNFENMPELHWAMGYPSILAVMLAVGLAMLLYFKRKSWL